jgi:hypothetical protein
LAAQQHEDGSSSEQHQASVSNTAALAPLHDEAEVGSRQDERGDSLDVTDSGKGVIGGDFTPLTTTATTTTEPELATERSADNINQDVGDSTFIIDDSLSDDEFDEVDNAALADHEAPKVADYTAGGAGGDDTRDGTGSSRVVDDVAIPTAGATAAAAAPALRVAVGHDDAASSSSASSDGDSWAVLFDSAGRPYYANYQTGQSSYDPPPLPPAPPSPKLDTDTSNRASSSDINGGGGATLTAGGGHYGSTTTSDSKNDQPPNGGSVGDDGGVYREEAAPAIVAAAPFEPSPSSSSPSSSSSSFGEMRQSSETTAVATTADSAAAAVAVHQHKSEAEASSSSSSSSSSSMTMMAAKLAETEQVTLSCCSMELLQRMMIAGALLSALKYQYTPPHIK